MWRIKDWAQAQGARCKDRSVGLLRHIKAYAFWLDKLCPPEGKGGMLVVDDNELRCC
ncbi:MAG: DegT/DnrJ/EryC1/StrS family aminotransferase [Desulfovermiculus sp.]